jgi:hypothetical protein
VKILRLVLLGLAALSFAAGGVALLHEASRPEPSNAFLATPAESGSGRHRLPPDVIAAARRAFEEELKAAPEYQAFFGRLKAVFASDYESFLVDFARRSAASGETGNADLLIAQAVHSLRLSRGVLAAKAGQAALEHIFELQLAMLQALGAKDPHLCVDFLYGTESSGFLEFSAQNRGLVAAMAVAGIDAIHDGEVSRIERETPTGADFEALEEALRGKGLDTPEIEALLDAKTVNPPIDEARMCRAGQIYLETIAAMPQEKRLRIYGLAVELMARS